MKWLYATSSEEIMTLQIRPIIQQDYATVVETAKTLRRWFTEVGVQQITEDLQTQEGLIASEGDQAIGFVTYAITVDKKVAELTWIAVRADFRRKGIGRCLVKALEGVLMRLGVSAIEVSTVADSVKYEPHARTRNFYHALGFSDVRVDRKWHPSGDDRLLLRKLLTKTTAWHEHS